MTVTWARQAMMAASLAAVGSCGDQAARSPEVEEELSRAVLSFSTYLGGAGLEGHFGDIVGGEVAVGNDGNVYITGFTTSPDFPVVNPLQDHGGGYDAFVVKLDPSGTQVVYSTFLGGSGDDFGRDIVVDDLGRVTVVGITNSVDFPTTKGAYQTSLARVDEEAPSGKFDTFITRLDPSGSLLEYSTYLGGPEFDVGFGIALTPATGAVTVVGRTFSPGFPTTPNASDATCGSDGLCNGLSDAYMAVLDPDGTRLLYSTYLGGSDHDWAFDVGLDAMGVAYVVGGTASPDFPSTAGVLQPYFGGTFDGFLAKLAPGGAVGYVTYLGGARSEVAMSVAVDDVGFAYVTGSSNSDDFPTTNGAFQRQVAGGSTGFDTGDAFVLKVAPNGAFLVFSTLLGGSESENIFNSELVHMAHQGLTSIQIDDQGAVHVVGNTYSTDFPVQNPIFEQSGGEADAFYAVLGPWGAQLLFSTYLGGASHDAATGLARNGSGCIFLTGITQSGDFPTQAPSQALLLGVFDQFVSEICLLYK